MSTDSNDRLALHHRIEFEVGTSNSIVLSGTDAQVARALLDNAERDLDALRHQRAQLQYQCEQASARVEKLHTALAPHKRLPTELLSYIFILSSGEGQHDFPPSGDPTPPWVLRAVCSRWRAIALSDRRLWNSISVDLVGNWNPVAIPESANLQDLVKTERFLSSILPQTGSLSLSLRVGGSMLYIQRAFDAVIAPRAHRVTDLYLGLPGLAYPMFLSMLLAQFVSLQSLELEFMSFFPANSPPIRDLPPTLREIVIAGDSSPFLCLQSPEVSWGHITNLNIAEIEDVQFSAVSSILMRCTALVKCMIKVYGSGRIDEHITLPLLQSLALTFEDGAVLNSLTLPGLKQLYMSPDTEGAVLPLVELSTMVRRSGCALEDVTMYAFYLSLVVHCDSAGQTAFFAATPSLVKVTMPNVP
ncbi:hypothetical protein Hypma_003513 [Hypsizygus marmoreus]|uniref:Uncharacterized protein n=1 Tax=Hypsizygus marmoreus TaxID=39966 RepID=A0A369J1W5_HYPMA|nr:hypothetical protein Hypma_003513 [Hypsizygus marmoreus]